MKYFKNYFIMPDFTVGALNDSVAVIQPRGELWHSMTECRIDYCL